MNSFLKIIAACSVLYGHTFGCDNITYSHPLLSMHTAKQLTVTEMNRCTIYPRCLLFDCCNQLVVQYVHHYFKSIHCQSHRNFICMFHDIDSKVGGGCQYDIPFAEKIKTVDLFQVTITHQMIEDKIANLPPTHYLVYEKLSNRKEFKIIYLVQGDEKNKLDPQVRDLNKHHDLIFLSFTKQMEGDLYFPKSNFCYGRLTLYLAARQLEISQGWLYNYYVFMDDDVDWFGSIQNYEKSLAEWQPAVGVPAYPAAKYPRRDVESISHVDFIFIGYHREAVEILHPWVLDFDDNCVWASQIMQSIESATIYRNYQLAFKGMNVVNTKHRTYPKACWNDGTGDPNKAYPFDQVLLSNSQALPVALKHCGVSSLKLFNHGDSSGMEKKKGNLTYHLIVSHNNHVAHYSRLNQSKTCPHLTQFNPGPAGCCSIDLAFNS